MFGDVFSDILTEDCENDNGMLRPTRQQRRIRSSNGAGHAGVGNGSRERELPMMPNGGETADADADALLRKLRAL